jgi:hypothetical protein
LKLVRLTVALCFLISSSAIYASDLQNGAPDAMLGYFGESPAECMSFHRKSDGLKQFTKDTYTFCGGSACEAEILGHKKTADGFQLRFRSRGNPKGWSATYRQIDANVFEETTDTQKPTTIVRCSQKDNVAGIGRNPSHDLNDKNTAFEMAAMAYAVFYASSVTEMCEGLTVNKEQAKTLLDASETEYAKFLIQHRLQATATGAVIDAREMLASEKRAAEYGVRADSKEIPNFCSEVLDAFGENGRVSRGLIIDPRKKA